MVNSNNKILFLDVLRGPAALLVLWDHYTGVWLASANKTWALSTLVKKYVNTPLGIIQDFGFMGVMIFFLISGYIITHVALREDRHTFLIKRLFRIYPPLFFSLLLAVSFGLFSGVSYKLSDFLLATTLLNYFKIPQNPISGVAWTLVIEMLFYVLVFFFIKIIKSRPSVSSFLMLLICFVNVIISRNFGDNFFLFSSSMSFVPYLLMGQLLYFVHNKKIKFRDFLVLSLLNYFVIMSSVISIHSDFYSVSNSYGITFAYSYMIFVIAMILSDKIKENFLTKVLSFFSKISYSLYLIHGTIGFFLLGVMTPRIGFTLAFIGAFFIVVVCAYASYLIIEKPSQFLAKRLLSRLQTAKLKNISFLLCFIGRKKTIS